MRIGVTSYHYSLTAFLKSLSLNSHKIAVFWTPLPPVHSTLLPHTPFVILLCAIEQEPFRYGAVLQSLTLSQQGERDAPGNGADRDAQDDQEGRTQGTAAAAKTQGEGGEEGQVRRGPEKDDEGGEGARGPNKVGHAAAEEGGAGEEGGPRTVQGGGGRAQARGEGAQVGVRRE